MLESDPVHVSVMPEEIIRFFQQIPEKENLFFLDGTAGEGGHSKLILETFPNSKLIFMDRDETMLKRAETRLDSFGSRATPHHSNFSEFTSDTLFKLGNVSSVDGIVLDLGISTYHFTNSEKGFSYAKEEPLDMRLDFSCKKTASEILKYYSEKELNRVFWEYGEERWSKKIASVLVERRKKESLQTSKELADLIAAIIPRKFWPPKTHPATRIFQALRIEVNSELLHIEKGLRQLAALLNKGGVFCVLSFHSLEDRIVKNVFRELTGKEKEYQLLTKKPLCPSEEEIQQNRPSRSAKLRVIYSP